MPRICQLGHDGIRAISPAVALQTEIPDYWAQRENMIEMLRIIGKLPMTHWATDAETARLLAGTLHNDHV
jgi:hypothetical protein